ncbi:MAG: hypothetical protein MRY74_00920 [Neomegalonema sp.]|nr:hypothetical protein [Neomegalonema sp.]
MTKPTHRQRRYSFAAAFLGAAAVLSAGLPTSAAAQDEASKNLGVYFSRVCVAALPHFKATPAALKKFGFDVTETVPGVFEANNSRSAYSIFVTPGKNADSFASCALSIRTSSVEEARKSLEALVKAKFGAKAKSETDGYGGLQYRVAGEGVDYVFRAGGKAVGAAMEVQVSPGG